jgi:outer membrane protein OmpA-like peptidoglycan-associated protein
MRSAVFGGAALVALVAGSAQAQVQSGLGLFGYVDGMYTLRTSTNNREFGSFPGLNGFTDARSGDGLSIDGKFGYAFVGGLDVALGGRYLDQSRGKKANDVFNYQNLDGKYDNADLDAGYTITGTGFGVRPFLGVRYQRWKADYVDNIGTPFMSTQKSWAIGPRVGVDAALNLFGPVSLFGGIDTAFLYGKARSTQSTFMVRSGSGSDRRLFWDIGGKIGLDWEVVPMFHIAAGYRAEWLDGIQFGTPAQIAAVNVKPAGRAGELIHGPFVRLAYNFGASAGGAAPAAAPPPAPGAGNSFIVFFDFDRAVLTPTAVQTIQQAAAQAKAGRSTRIEVTGHADRAGSDAYNLALSLRRANAVKDQMVREGIAANQIAVMGRGESQPLLPTADGVREPQNRRVEIVLG